MQYGKRLILFCFTLLFSVQLSAQLVEETDITGLWKGSLYNDTTGRYLKYEIAISKNKGKYSGYTHTYFIVDDKEYHGVKKARIRIKDGDVIVEDVELIAHNYPVSPNKGVRQIDVLTLKIKDGVMSLVGPFSTTRTREYHSLTGMINVQRKNNFWQSALVPHLEELGLAKNLSFVEEERELEKQNNAIAANVAAKEITKPVVKNEPVEVKKPDPVKVEPAPAEKKEAVAVKKAEPVTKKEEPVVKKEAPETVKPKPVETVKTTPVKPQSAPVKKADPVPPTAKPTEIVKTVPVKTEPVNETPKPVETKNTELVKSKDPEPVKPRNNTFVNAAVDIGSRKIETIEAVYYKSDSLELTLYDNGEVDGDTVSVLMNGEVIMPRVGLSTRAVRKKISTVNTGDSIQLIMYAENLGSLPPNTGLLIVYDGTDRYEIRFSGDLKKSAAIVFRRKEN